MKASGLLAGGALVALLLAGCGGDNSASVSNATTAAGAAATTAAGSGDAASTSTPSFTGDANSDFCKVAKEVTSDDFADLSADNPDLKSGLEKANEALERAKNSAPSEIKQDVATLADALKSYTDLLAQYDYDFAKLTAAAQKDPQVLQRATETLSDAKLEAANSRIVAYAAQVCGIDTSTTS